MCGSKEGRDDEADAAEKEAAERRAKEEQKKRDRLRDESLDTRSTIRKMMDKVEEVGRCEGATLRLCSGGAFYAPHHLQAFAAHWPKLVVGDISGNLHHLEVKEGA